MSLPEPNSDANMDPQALSELERCLHYRFINAEYLEEALRHSSYVNEQGQPGIRDNERLEFLGDAVVNLIVGHILMDRYPDLKEGDLSRMRSQLVNESQLAAIARTIDLGSYIRLGRGERRTGGQNKPSILADTLEALVAAVYLDGGFDAAFRMIETRILEQIHSERIFSANFDYKSQLQEYVQTAQIDLPVYTIMDESGPDHDKTFHIQLRVGDLCTTGVGKSKKLAEQDAAGKGLAALKQSKEI